MAFPSILRRTWVIRCSSPFTTCGTSSATVILKNSFLRRTESLSKFSRWSSTPRRENGWSSISILSASILEKSRMSLISANRCLPEFLMICRFFSFSRSPSLSIRKSVNPRMAFIGVLISCDMFARNSLFSLLAASACSLARRSWSSVSRLAVISSFTAR